MAYLQTIPFIENIVPISVDFRNFLNEKIIVQKYKKGDFLQKSGQICQHIYFIRKGLVRGFITFKQTDVTTWVSVEGELVTSISGFFNQEPGLQNIECLENCTLEALHYEDLQYCLEHYAEVGKLFQHLLIQYYISAEHRSFLARIPGALDRVKYLQKEFNPLIVERTPKKHLASLLGVRPETFSRLEHSIAADKEQAH